MVEHWPSVPTCEGPKDLLRSVRKETCKPSFTSMSPCLWYSYSITRQAFRLLLSLIYLPCDVNRTLHDGYQKLQLQACHSQLGGAQHRSSMHLQDQVFEFVLQNYHSRSITAILHSPFLAVFKFKPTFTKSLHQRAKKYESYRGRLYASAEIELRAAGDFRLVHAKTMCSFSARHA